ncbi:MAG: cupredoxin domain-containing protein [Methanoregula sp.]
MRSVYLLVLAFLCVMGAVGCTQTQGTGLDSGTGTQTSATATTAPVVSTSTTTSVNDNTVNIRDMVFTPSTITVPTGAIVRWVNRDSVTHSVVFSKESKISTSGALSGGQSFSVKFTAKGTYSYYDGMHPSVTGTVIVA